ncbi:MAG: M48 family metallopeptidase [Sterolibacterium sp.]|nr:M48 family metallopeptidase [Sterolibacterium sp.]MBP9798664.1 M48 family metallopeptidase [Sterolibacterium sp.]
MTSSLFSLLFLAAVVASFLLHAGLSWRQLRHVRAHRAALPVAFAQQITLTEHHKAADYSCAKARLAIVEQCIHTLFLLALTLGGGVQAIVDACMHVLPAQDYLYGLALVAAVMVLGFLVDLPLDLYRTFVLEARYGFNTLTARLYLADLCRQAVLSVLIGAPLLLAILWLMTQMGALWWLWVWLFWMGFNLLAVLLYPTLIAPLFNTFRPLEDSLLKARIEALLARCGFRASGLFVMDGSKRSTHGNAYFTGFGQARRIVFYDTLLERLTPPQIDAVLAHELGHYHHRHVWRRLMALALLTLLFFAALGGLIDAPWFYGGLGVVAPQFAPMSAGGTALALLLFFLVVPSFTFLLSPALAQLSRRHEYQADTYAAAQTNAQDLVSALVRLYRDNAATLTPDPWHSLFHDSHPPAALRVAHLNTL